MKPYTSTKLRAIDIDGVRWFFITDLHKSFGVPSNNISNTARRILNRDELKVISKKDFPAHPALICHKYILTNQTGLDILVIELKRLWLKNKSKGLMDIQRITSRPYLKKYLSHSVASNSSSQQTQPTGI